jgi:hypothetical protein
MTKDKIEKIDKALKLHSSYDNNYSRGTKYLDEMDILAYNYTGAPGIRLSKMLDDYYVAVGVKNLNEAFERLKNKETI